MGWFNHDWLGYAANAGDAVHIIRDTGIFYLIIAAAFLISFLWIVTSGTDFDSKSKKRYIYNILFWVIAGYFTIFYSDIPFTVFNFAIIVLSIVTLYYFQFFNCLLNYISLNILPCSQTENKKLMYVKALIEKKQWNFAGILCCSFINERILWLLILYKTACALRASLSL